MRVTGHAIEGDLVKRLEALIERRNRLVHEENETEVSAEEASESFRAILRLAEELGRIALEAGIPVRAIEADWGAIEA